MSKSVTTAILVAALGYFVDIYDLLLFGFVRKASLQDMNYNDQEVFDYGLLLQNWQMAGMLCGGILWGVLGDRKGRVKVLYFSIALYSVANILNGMAQGYADYALYRFIAGVGLAGELGAGITLVAELMPRNRRGFGVTIVAAVGLTGALLAWVISKHFTWQTCYFIGGGLGLLLLILRIKVQESGIFEQTKARSDVQKGNFFALFTKRERFLRFLRCIFIGTPTWFVVGVLILFSDQFGKAKGLEGISPGNAIAACYTGLIIGDIGSGLLSQWLQSRKKVMFLFLMMNVLAVIWYLSGSFSSPALFYFSHFLLGISAGFWVIFVTIAAEQFGVNLRATVATSVPNFARGMQVPINASFKYLKDNSVGVAGLTLGGNVLAAAWVIGAVCLIIPFLALWGMKDTFHTDLDYIEE